MLDQARDQEMLQALLPEGFGLRYEPAEDASVDSEYVVTRDGADTRWTIQVLEIGGGYGLNEHFHDRDGELEAVRSHAMVDRIEDLAAPLRKLAG